jgi:hypothetical protein
MGGVYVIVIGVGKPDPLSFNFDNTEKTARYSLVCVVMVYRAVESMNEGIVKPIMPVRRDLYRHLSLARGRENAGSRAAPCQRYEHVGRSLCKPRPGLLLRGSLQADFQHPNSRMFMG